MPWSRNRPRRRARPRIGGNHGYANGWDLYDLWDLCVAHRRWVASSLCRAKSKDDYERRRRPYAPTYRVSAALAPSPYK
jgi:hypothetical protein